MASVPGHGPCDATGSVHTWVWAPSSVGLSPVTCVRGGSDTVYTTGPPTFRIQSVQTPLQSPPEGISSL